ncbi:MAG: cysteine--tRNA ligase [Phycisphaerales bacterium JB063]
MTAHDLPEIRFYNSLTKRLESFKPVAPPQVYMYNCGPTVYDYAHIGNFKAFLFADVLRRFLELVGYDVEQVMNLTDVGHMTEDDIADGGGQDKMDAASQRLAAAKKSGKLPAGVDLDPNDPYQIARFYIDAFVEDAKLLGVKVAQEYPGQMPRATAHVQGMQAMTQTLIDKGHAYIADDGVVYFSIESFPSYGNLSGNTMDKLRGGAGGRVSDANQSAKRHPGDFLLWKPDDSHLMKWDSPWGAGYPGWHLECSVMARELLGRETIDIHTGGEDNIFPHHECEIAQSRCAHGTDSFANFWMHARHLMVEGEKMSKSKGNFYTVRQVLDGAVTGRAVDPAVLRLELIKAQYRSNLNFTRKGLEDSASAVRKLRAFAAGLGGGSPAEVGLDHPAVARFVEALADDLNTAGALGEVFGYLNEPDDDPAIALGVLAKFDAVLGVLEPAAAAIGDDDTIAKQVAAIDAARAAKDFATSDTIRAQLEVDGYDVKTTKDGTVATKRLA